ncbi:MAG TPA: hypothetical protein DIC23_03295 [Planctomycetaceae bacterium]|jgi:hypothetical protein|nr:hypothetical protein [Planctomycetaceae bacterium]HCK52216.1 hypothetical protein [Planctomycetaceae bacterium]|tara:strand:- start:1116 stop:1400 length:285 start_codon:yes stop_codon:yes gene_type:complete
MEQEPAQRPVVGPTGVDDPDRRPPRSFGLVIISSVVLLLAYPLSYGPVMYQVSMGRWPGLWSVFDMVYAPIEWLADSSQLGQELVDWYLGVWGA